MDELKLKILDITDHKQLEDYESKLFNAFNIESSWVGNNYKRIDGRKLQANIPYENLIIFITTDSNNSIIAASAVNKDLQKFCQIEQMGYPFFNKYPDRTSFCEGIGFYTIPEAKVNRFEIGTLFTTQVFSYMKNLGYKEYFGTTSPRISRLYTKMYGFKVIDTFSLDKGEEYLLYKELS